MSPSEMFHTNAKSSQNDKRRIIKLELETRNALFRLQALIATMKNELALLPVGFRVFTCVTQSDCLDRNLYTTIAALFWSSKKSLTYLLASVRSGRTSPAKKLSQTSSRNDAIS